jgi:hypothetical protein
MNPSADATIIRSPPTWNEHFEDVKADFLQFQMSNWGLFKFIIFK